MASKGDQRVDQAITAGATVGAILAAAQKDIIAAIDKTVMQVIAARLGAASSQLKPVLAAAARAASGAGNTT